MSKPDERPKIDPLREMLAEALAEIETNCSQLSERARQALLLRVEAIRDTTKFLLENELETCPEYLLEKLLTPLQVVIAELPKGHRTRINRSLRNYYWQLNYLGQANHSKRLGRSALKSPTEQVIMAGDIVEWSYGDLTRIRGLGPKSAEELDKALRKIGLSLAQELDPSVRARYLFIAESLPSTWNENEQN